MPALTCQVDHVVIAVSDLTDAIDRWGATGLVPVVGGEHPGGTTNALIRGPRPAYVELITTLPRAEGPWADRVRAGSGLLSWALSVDDLESAREAVIDLGHSPAPIVEGARTTPDGEVIRWRMCEIGGPFDPQWPFLIQWRDPMPDGPGEGPIVEGLSLPHPEPERLARLLEHLGLGPADLSWSPSAVLVDQRGVQITITPADLPPRLSLQVTDGPAVADPATPVEIELDSVIVEPCADVRSGRAGALWAEVEAAHATMGVEHWPAPYVGDIPEDAYERVTRPERYRTLTARATAWARVLERRGLATISTLDTTDLFGEGPEPACTSALQLVPTAPGALPLVIGVWALDACAEVGLTIGVGSPPQVLASVPDCGCDACDEGSAAWVSQIDDAVLAVVEGGTVWESSSGTTTVRSPGGILVITSPTDSVEGRLTGAPWL